jgi:hypothetical protein
MADRPSVTLSILLAGLAFSPAAAHHSVAANFDRSTTIELTGTITAVHLRNPHSQYVLDVVEDDGTVTQWFIEWSDRNALVRRKVDLGLIKVGDVLTITAWPSRRLDAVGFFVQAILPNGALYRDCGFLEFRSAVAESREFSCDTAAPGR